MEIILNKKIDFNMKQMHDIISKSIKNGVIKTLNFTGTHSIILYAVVSNNIFLALVQKKEVKEHILFYEYPIDNIKKGYIQIQAEVSIENMLDTLNPNLSIELKNFENNCRAKNMTFDDNERLLKSYAKVRHADIIRYCKAVNKYVGTSYIICYNVLDKKCIQRIETYNSQ